MKKAKKKSRKIDIRKIRTTKTYDLPELAIAADKAIETIWRYRREGMPTLPGSNGKLVDGAEFKLWAHDRNKSKKRPCKIDEFFCFGGECRTQRRPEMGSVIIRKSNQNLCSVIANCDHCGKQMRKGWAMKNIAAIEATMESFIGNVQDLARYRDSPTKRK